MSWLWLGEREEGVFALFLPEAQQWLLGVIQAKKAVWVRVLKTAGRVPSTDGDPGEEYSTSGLLFVRVLSQPPGRPLP